MSKVTNPIVLSVSFCNLRFSESGYFYFFEANFEALRNSSKQTVQDYPHQIRLNTERRATSDGRRATGDGRRATNDGRRAQHEAKHAPLLKFYKVDFEEPGCVGGVLGFF